jgi:CBS domain-containing protein
MSTLPTDPVVADFMTPTPITIDAGLTLEDALDRMFQAKVHHIPVVNERDDLVGVLSTRDIALVASVAGAAFGRVTAAQAMTHASVSCPRWTPLAEAVQQLERNRLGSVVVSRGRKPIGIFTTTDAMRALRSYLCGEVVPAEAEPLPEAPAEEPTRDTAGGRARLHVSAHGPSRNDGTLSWLTAHV